MKHINFILVFFVIIFISTVSYFVGLFQRGHKEGASNFSTTMESLKTLRGYYEIKNIKKYNDFDKARKDDLLKDIFSNSDKEVVNKWICFLTKGDQVFNPFVKNRIKNPHFK